MIKNSLVEVRKQAEQAVRDMPDGDLKVKAFETILTHLLSNSTDRQAPLSTTSTSGGSKGQSKKKETVSQVPKSAGDRILFLKTEDFFTTQRSIAEIRLELKKNGWHYPVTSLSGTLQSLVQKRQLRRERA